MTKSLAKEASFEEQLAQLEEIVKQLDSDSVPLEDAIKHYERGIQLSSRLNAFLDGAQRRIEILTRGANGETIAQPFAEEEVSHDGQ